MRSAGLRLQIVLAVCGLMALAFVPLFFALASLTRVALHGIETDAARAIGNAVASHAADLETPDRPTLERLMTGTSVVALCAGDVCAGRSEGRTLSTRAIGAHGEATAWVRTSDSAERAAPLIRLYGGYTTAFALALAFLVYVVLTRLIVKPVEGIARAADRVASGARKLDVPREGPRELAQLAESIHAMTTRLIADEEALRRKVAELTEAQAQITRGERMASVGRLAAGMAHEIGNPVTAIMGMQDLMLGGDVPPSEQNDYVARMRKETERVHRILRDLLDFARPETSASPDSTASTRALGATANVQEVFHDVESLLKPQKQFRDTTIVIEGEDVEVPIAPERLTQVILNLALNAGDAMAAGTSPRPRKLVMRSRRPSGTAKRTRIEVEDTGPGVAPHVRDRLFMPFVTTKEVGQGTGLGLAVCRGIIEASGGRISLDESYREGARFVIEL